MQSDYQKEEVRSEKHNSFFFSLLTSHFSLRTSFFPLLTSSFTLRIMAGKLENRRKFMRESWKRLARFGMEMAGSEAPPSVPIAPVSPPVANKSSVPPTDDSPIWLNRVSGMTYSKLGRTRLMMSRLAMGCASVQPHNPEAVLAAAERVNLLDTARNFGESEVVLGSLLPQIRDKVWISTKTPPIDASVAHSHSPDEADERSLERVRFFEANLASSLARLKIDPIDIYMLGAVENPETVRDSRLMAAMARAKDEGKIRHTGISIHVNVREVAEAAVDSGAYDVIMLPLHPLNIQSISPILEEARQKDIGVIGIMATLGLTGNENIPLHELPPELNSHQLTYLYMLRHTAHAGFAINLSSKDRVEQNLHLPSIPIGIMDGIELDAVVYDEFWPECPRCEHKRTFRDTQFDQAARVRYRRYDTSGLLSVENESADWRICESCSASAIT